MSINLKDYAGGILDEAKGLITKTRAGQHGDMEQQHAIAGEFWTTYLRAKGILAEGKTLDAGDVAMCMSLLKKSREASSGFNRDNYIDDVGYMGIVGAIRAAQDERGKAEAPVELQGGPEAYDKADAPPFESPFQSAEREQLLRGKLAEINRRTRQQQNDKLFEELSKFGIATRVISASDLYHAVPCDCALCAPRAR